MNMKQIDFETLCGECKHQYVKKVQNFNCSHKNNKGAKATPADCPIWASLPDVPEPDQSKDTERFKPTWLEYEGY